MMGEINGGDEHQDDHAHAHAHHNAIMLQPGETRDLTWTFAAAEAFEFGCNIPGHYESGMFGEITILPRQDVTGPSV